MPKRAPTPPPTDDTRFFTVVNPYPAQPYITLEDGRTFARWIACIVGREHLLAFHHKPKSPNVVIIETTKVGPDFSKLMGEHRWREMLRRPSAMEMHEVSYIFPCTLSTTRAVEKAGWLYRDVALSWFKKWSPESDRLIISPYPQPHHCSPPAEDITRCPLCRPIPKNESSSASPKPSRDPTLYRPKSPISTSEDDAPAPPSTSDFADTLSTQQCWRAPPRFVPAIHGSDVPKASKVVVNLPALPQQVSLTEDDNDDDDDDEKAEKDLCSAHGVLCVRGICKECAARKREARLAERARQREEERSRRGRGRCGGRGGCRSHQHERISCTDDQRARRPAAGERIPEMPVHLKSWAGVAYSASTDAVANSPKSRLRDDIRAEIASRKANAKSGASTTTRTMPAHLRKGASSASPTSGVSSSSASISAASTSVSSEDSLAESVLTSSAPESISDPSEDGQSSIESEPEKNRLPQPDLGPDIRRGPWGTGVDWRMYAGIRDGDAESVATGATADAFINPWKYVRSMQPTVPRWAFQEDGLSVGARTAWDDDESDDDPEPF